MRRVAALMSGRRFAYADPPYLGCAVRYYGHLHTEAARYDDPAAHRELIERLEDEVPDGWALSLHAPSLPVLLPMCRAGVRVAAWTKPFSGVRPGVRGRFSWEPVIYRTSLAWGYGPQFSDVFRADAPRRDASVAKGGFAGRKPEAFTAWICDLVGYRSGDELVDLFEGSGAVRRALRKVDQRNDPELFELCGEAA